MGSLPVGGRAVNTGRSRVRRALLLGGCASLLVLPVAGCGGEGGSAAGPATPAAATPVAAAAPAGPLTPGDVLTPGPGTPPVVARALRAGRPLVVAFVMRGSADDDRVRAALREVARSGPGARGVVYAVYDVTRRRDFGSLPALLDVTGTPTVVVVGRDRAVVNVWTGLVDAEMLRQSVALARDAAPR